jgi:hypothetical protein
VFELPVCVHYVCMCICICICICMYIYIYIYIYILYACVCARPTCLDLNINNTVTYIHAYHSFTSGAQRSTHKTCAHMQIQVTGIYIYKHTPGEGSRSAPRSHPSVCQHCWRKLGSFLGLRHLFWACPFRKDLHFRGRDSCSCGSPDIGIMCVCGMCVCVCVCVHVFVPCCLC